MDSAITAARLNAMFSEAAVEGEDDSAPDPQHRGNGQPADGPTPEGKRSEPPKKPTKELTPWQPFPVDVLPEPVCGYVKAGSRAMKCDPAYIALPMLVGLIGAIGATRRVRIKSGWYEPAIVWASVVAESGTLKSPAQSLALRPLLEAQGRHLERLPELQRQFEQDKAMYEADYSAWKRGGRRKGEPPPEKPVEPSPERSVVNDITIEALAEILEKNPRGVLAATDELGAWLGAFDQYRAGKGSDAAKWLSVFRGEPLIVDRKTGSKKTIYVKRPAVSVAGTIQPKALRRALGEEYFDNGLAARLLLANPPRQPKRWSEAGIATATYKAVEGLYGGLLALGFADSEEPCKPIDVVLSPEAKGVWIDFYNEHAAAMEKTTGKLAAAYAKLEAYAARFALVFTMIKAVVDADNMISANNVVDADSMISGVELVRWFRHEVERVYAIMAEDDAMADRRRLVEWIRARGGTVTPRDLRHHGFNGDTQAAEGALIALAAAGHGEWRTASPGEQGGRPRRTFVLTTKPEHQNQNPENIGENGGFGFGSAGDDL